jgi:hypothetical protein
MDQSQDLTGTQATHIPLIIIMAPPHTTKGKKGEGKEKGIIRAPSSLIPKTNSPGEGNATTKHSSSSPAEIGSYANDGII